MHDDDVRETPPAVVGAVAIGTAPLPFLAVYATLFMLHGWISPVHPPDITSTQTGELIAGLVAAAIFVVLSFTLWMFLNRRRRWPFVIGQLATLGTTIYFLSDETTGGTAVSVVVLATSVVSLVLGFAPDGWTHVGRTAPAPLVRVYGWRIGSGDEQPAGDPTALPRSSEPGLVEPSSLRRRR